MQSVTLKDEKYFLPKKELRQARDLTPTGRARTRQAGSGAHACGLLKASTSPLKDIFDSFSKVKKERGQKNPLHFPFKFYVGQSERDGKGSQ